MGFIPERLLMMMMKSLSEGGQRCGPGGGEGGLSLLPLGPLGPPAIMRQRAYLCFLGWGGAGPRWLKL